WEGSDAVMRSWDGHFLNLFLKHFGGESVTLSQSQLALIAQASPNSLPLGQRAGDLAYGWLTAGHILMYTLRLKHFLPRLASAASAIRVLEWRYQIEKRPSSPSYIKNAWSEFRP